MNLVYRFSRLLTLYSSIVHPLLHLRLARLLPQPTDRFPGTPSRASPFISPIKNLEPRSLFLGLELSVPSHLRERGWFLRLGRNSMKDSLSALSLSSDDDIIDTHSLTHRKFVHVNSDQAKGGICRCLPRACLGVSNCWSSRGLKR